MDVDVAYASQSSLIELSRLPGLPLSNRLRLLDHDGLRAIFIDGTPLHIYDAEDRLAESAAIALLSSGQLASRAQLASAFGRHRNTVSRLNQRLERGGMSAVVPGKRGPKGPHKVTPAVRQIIEESAHLGCVAVAAKIREQTGVALSAAHVSRLLKQLRSHHGLVEEPELWEDTELESPSKLAEQAPLETTEPTSTASQEADSEPPVVLPEIARGRYLGASLYYPALEALGLLKAGLSCFRLPNSELFGVRATTLTLFFLNLFSKTTVEAAKQLRRWEFGPLVGTPRAPAVKTLRRKLAELVKQGQASRFGQLLLQRWVEQGLVATAYLYVDGHMKAYTGKRKLPEVWNSQRRMPLPGFHTYFVNDQQGRPLLFITEEADSSLAQAMPSIVAAIREAVGDRPFTIIFDRGGFDCELFNWLTGEGIDFITYQRSQPGLPAEQFRRRKCRFEGRRISMRVAEDEVTVNRSGPWRRIVVQEGRGQVPILTSLRPGLAPTKIACLVFARWRQENFFKYMTEHLGLDQLLGNAFEEAEAAQLVANPERKRLDAELRDRRQRLAAERVDLAQSMVEEPPQFLYLVWGLRSAQEKVVARVRALEEEINQLTAARKAQPKKVPLSQAGKREVLRLEQKAIIDRVKITAYNAEEWLLDRLAAHYHNPHDIRALLRSFAELSGQIRTTPVSVEIMLDPPDIPLHRRALRCLCVDLNRIGATFPGTQLPVTYAVAMHHSEQSV